MSGCECWLADVHKCQFGCRRTLMTPAAVRDIARAGRRCSHASLSHWHPMTQHLLQPRLPSHSSAGRPCSPGSWFFLLHRRQQSSRAAMLKQDRSMGPQRRLLLQSGPGSAGRPCSSGSLSLQLLHSVHRQSRLSMLSMQATQQQCRQGSRRHPHLSSSDPWAMQQLPIWSSLGMQQARSYSLRTPAHQRLSPRDTGMQMLGCALLPWDGRSLWPPLARHRPMSQSAALPVSACMHVCQGVPQLPCHTAASMVASCRQCQHPCSQQSRPAARQCSRLRPVNACRQR